MIYLSEYFKRMKERPMSVEIIGGADSPTSIFIATSINWPLIMEMGIIIVLIVGGFIVWKKKHK